MLHCSGRGDIDLLYVGGRVGKDTKRSLKGKALN